MLFSRLSLVNGLAPILAPVVGGQLARVTSWRGTFVVLTGLGVALLLAGALGLPETLPAGRRTAGGAGTTLRGLGGLLRDRGFTGVVLTSGLASASMFAYIAGATFVLQELHGLSPAQFSLVFGSNAVGIVVLTQVGGALGRRGWPARRLLPVGLGLNVGGALLLLAAVVLDLPVAVLLVALFVMVASLGLVFPTATTLALAEHPERAGAASSLLGLGQFVLGGLVAPLVGLAGEGTAVPLGVVAASCSLAAVLVYGVVARPRLHRSAVGAAPVAPPA